MVLGRWYGPEVVSSELTLLIINPEINTAFEGKEVLVEVPVADEAETNKRSEWIRQSNGCTYL